MPADIHSYSTVHGTPSLKTTHSKSTKLVLKKEMVLYIGQFFMEIWRIRLKENLKEG